MLSLRGGCSNIRVQTSNASKPCSIFSVKPAPASCWFTSQPATVKLLCIHFILRCTENTQKYFCSFYSLRADCVLSVYTCIQCANTDTASATLTISQYKSMIIIIKGRKYLRSFSDKAAALGLTSLCCHIWMFMSNSNDSHCMCSYL